MKVTNNLTQNPRIYSQFMSFMSIGSKKHFQYQIGLKNSLFAPLWVNLRSLKGRSLSFTDQQIESLLELNFGQKVS